MCQENEPCLNGEYHEIFRLQFVHPKIYPVPNTLVWERCQILLNSCEVVLVHN
jgi:hypothetical protein